MGYHRVGCKTGMSYNGFHYFARHSIVLFISQERLYSGLYIKLQIRGEAKQSI